MSRAFRVFYFGFKAVVNVSGSFMVVVRHIEAGYFYVMVSVVDLEENINRSITIVFGMRGNWGKPS